MQVYMIFGGPGPDLVQVWQGLSAAWQLTLFVGVLTLTGSIGGALVGAFVARSRRRKKE
jgi:hypothetical protein